jgi:hypothetical protein
VAVLRIVVNEQGDLSFVHDDLLIGVRDELGDAITKRASHVEPDGTGWTADMGPSGGPVLGPFSTRGAALAAERAWLQERGIG